MGPDYADPRQKRSAAADRFTVRFPLDGLLQSGPPFAVFPAHTVAVAATHPPLATLSHTNSTGPFGSGRVVMK
jgi:hypothetical protein